MEMSYLGRDSKLKLAMSTARKKNEPAHVLC